MNFKKLIISVFTVLLATVAFSLPKPQQDNNPALEQQLQEAMAQLQEMQKGFDEKLLPLFKDLVATNASDFDKAEALANQINKTLNDMVAPALKDVDMAQVNEQYRQNAQAYGLPQQEFTKESLTELVKALYVEIALGYFAQTQKLSEYELTTLMEIFFPSDEGEEVTD